MENAINPLATLDARRVALGMTIDQLARRTGVSSSTVERVLSGRYGSASFDTIQRIAAAVGAEVRIEGVVQVAALRHEQAEKKARRLIGDVAPHEPADDARQAPSPEVREAQIDQLIHKLLSGSNRKLWAD